MSYASLWPESNKVAQRADSFKHTPHDSEENNAFCGICMFGRSRKAKSEKKERRRLWKKRESVWNGELDGQTTDEKAPVKKAISPEELHRLPTQETLDEVGKVILLDRNRNKISFKEIVESAAQRRTIIIFIRHFFCGMCYGYVRNLSADLLPGSLEAMSTPTNLVIIGCGDPVLIPQYIKETNCAFPIYADPGRKLYQKLGFCINGEANADPPRYVRKYSPSLLLNLLISGKMAAKTAKSSGGLIQQNGGEMIWIDGKLKFIHRMRNTTDHIEVEELEQILKSQDIELAEQREGLGHGWETKSVVSQDTKRSKRSRLSWTRPLSFIREKTGSLLGDRDRPSSLHRFSLRPSTSRSALSGRS